jgi:hypothetical protein
MRKSGYSKRMKQLNTIYTEVCDEFDKSVFISTREILDITEDQYAHYLTLENKLIRVRVGDGMHFTRAGGELVINRIMRRIGGDFSFRTQTESRDYYLQ